MPRQGQARHTATISLGIMGAGFLATFPLGGWPGALLHGGFEAGLVGGLADWFAVTALFRHPLGLPIPHTALLPKNRDKVVQSLVSAMENELLTKESIVRKAEEFRIGEKALGLLENHLPEATGVVVRISDYLLRQLPLEKLVPLVARELEEQIRRVDAEGALRRVAEEALARGYEEKALFFMLDKADGFLAQETIRQQLGAMAASALQNLPTGGIMGFAVNAFVGFMSEEKLGTLLQGALLSKLREMREYEDHPLRELLLQTMRGALVKLPEQPGLLAEIEALRDRFGDSGALERHLSVWAESMQKRAIAFVQEPRFADEFVQPALAGLIAGMRENTEMVNGLQRWVQDRLAQFVENNHYKIGKLVRENIDKLDNDSLIAMMEDKIGGDLQWIRVNGAVCGFLIGLLLEGINLAF